VGLQRQLGASIGAPADGQRVVLLRRLPGCTGWWGPSGRGLGRKLGRAGCAAGGAEVRDLAFGDDDPMAEGSDAGRDEGGGWKKNNARLRTRACMTETLHRYFTQDCARREQTSSSLYKNASASSRTWPCAERMEKLSAVASAFFLPCPLGQSVPGPSGRRAASGLHLFTPRRPIFSRSWRPCRLDST